MAYTKRDLADDLESLVGASTLGVTEVYATPASPWLIPAIAGGTGYGMRLIGSYMRRPWLGELGEGLWIPAAKTAVKMGAATMKAKFAAKSTSSVNVAAPAQANLVTLLPSNRATSVYQYPPAEIYA